MEPTTLTVPSLKNQHQMKAFLLFKKQQLQLTGSSTGKLIITGMLGCRAGRKGRSAPGTEGVACTNTQIDRGEGRGERELEERRNRYKVSQEDRRTMTEIGVGSPTYERRKGDI